MDDVAGHPANLSPGALVVDGGADSGEPTLEWLAADRSLSLGALLEGGAALAAAPYLALHLARAVVAPVTPAAALAAVDGVLGAVVVCEEALPASNRFATGSVRRPSDQLDLALEACLVELDGEVIDSATGAAPFGQPAEAVVAAANRLERIDAGTVVLCGPLTPPVRLGSNAALTVTFTNLGSISFSRRRSVQP